MAVGGDDIRPVNRDEILASGCPSILGLLGDKVVVVDSWDSVMGIGTAETSEMIKAKINATRPARERILLVFEEFMI